MANELQVISAISGTVYFRLVSPTGQAWRTDTHVFEPYTDADWANYTIAATRQGTSLLYTASYPTGYTPSVGDSAIGHLQAGGSPLPTDRTIAVGSVLTAPTAPAIATQILDTAIDGTVTLAQAVAVILAYAAGNTAISTGDAVYKAAEGTATRIDGHLNADGSRTITLTPPAPL